MLDPERRITPLPNEVSINIDPDVRKILDGPEGRVVADLLYLANGELLTNHLIPVLFFAQEFKYVDPPIYQFGFLYRDGVNPTVTSNKLRYDVSFGPTSNALESGPGGEMLTLKKIYRSIIDATGGVKTINNVEGVKELMSLVDRALSKNSFILSDAMGQMGLQKKVKEGDKYAKEFIRAYPPEFGKITNIEQLEEELKKVLKRISHEL